MRGVVTGFAVVLAFAFGAGAASAATVSGTVTFAGGITPAGVGLDLSPRPCTGSSFHVEVSPVGSPASSAFSISDVPAGTYEITTNVRPSSGSGSGPGAPPMTGAPCASAGSSAGNVTSAPVPVTVTVGVDVSGVAVSMIRGSAITGTLTLPEGVNRTDISVYASLSSWIPGGTQGSANVLSDGTYSIVGLRAGTYRVQFQGRNGANVQQATQTVTVATTGTDVTLDKTLQSGATITGTIALAQGVTGESGTSFYISAQSEPCCNGSGSASTTGPGSYAITGLPVGTYTLTVSASGRNLVADPITVRVPASLTVADVTITMHRGGVISGTAAAPEGIDRTHLCVTAQIFGNTSGQGGYGNATVAADGSFSMSGLRDGAFRVSYAPCYNRTENVVATSQTVTVLAGQTTNADATFVVGGSITGNLSSPGADLTTVCVSAYPERGGIGGVSNQPVAADGAYEVGQLLSGSYRVTYQNCSGGTGNLIARSLIVNVVLGSATAQDVVLQSGGMVTGHVDVPDGVDARRVNIQAQRQPWLQDGGSGSTQVASDGTFTIRGLAAGTFSLRASAWGQNVISLSQSVTVAVGQTATANLSLLEGGRISGSVEVPADANPASVCVDAQPVMWTQDATYGNAPVGADGSYSVVGLKSGSYIVRFSTGCNGAKANLISTSTAPTVAVTRGATRTGVDMTMGAGGIIGGTISLPAGSTLPEGGLCLNANRIPWSNDGGWANGNVSADGTYQLTALRSGTYRLRVYGCYGSNGDLIAPTFPGDITATAGATTGNHDFTMERGGSISGTITVPTGSSPQGICVDATRIPYVGGDGGDGYYGSARVASDGTYSMKGLRTGSYTVNFRADTYCGGGNLVAGTKTGVAVVQGADTGATNFAMSEGGIISGVVTAADSGVPLSYYCIYVYPTWSSQSGSSYGDSVTDSNGAFTVSGLRTDKYTVQYSSCRGSGNYVGTSRSGVAVVQGLSSTANQQLALGGTISGTLVDVDGNGVPGMCVNASLPPNVVASLGGDGTGYNGWTQTSSDDGSAGSYTISGLHPGTYAVHFDTCGAGANFAVDDRADVVVSAGQVASGIDAVAATAGEIVGQVFDNAGLPLKQICLGAETFPTRETGNFYAWAQTDDQGNYDLTGLGTGTYRVTAMNCDPRTNIGGEVRPAIAVTLGEKTSGEDFTLQPGGEITGRILKSDGTPAGGVCVSASTGSFNDAGGSWGYTETETNGTFAMRSLAAGTFTLDYSDCGIGAPIDLSPAGAGVVSTLVSGIAVTSGGATDIGDAQFTQGGGISGTVTTEGAALEGVCVSAQATVDPSQPDGFRGDAGSAVTDGNGEYAIRGLGTGSGTTHTYHVRFSKCVGEHSVADEWYGGSANEEDSTAVTVTRGQIASSQDAAMQAAGTIAGSVTTDAGGAAAEVCVAAFTPNQSTTTIASPAGFAATDDAGHYEISDIKAGSYRVYFAPCGLNSSELRGSWYGAADSLATSTPVAVVGGATTSAINARLVAWGVDTPTCNPMLFVGGDCSNPALYRAPAVSPDGSDPVDVSSPASPVDVLIDPNMVLRSTVVSVDSTPPSSPGAQAPPSTNGGKTDSLSAYIDVKVRQGERNDSGGNWDPPLELTFDVPATAVDVPDEQIKAYFDTSESSTWTPIPYIGSRAQPITLMSGESDGYFVTGIGTSRQVHILTRHATTFALFGPAGSGPIATPHRGATNSGGTAPSVSATSPTPTAKVAQTLRASIAKTLKRRGSLALPMASAQGLFLTWKSTTSKICTVIRTKKKGKVIGWRVRALRPGLCKLTAMNAGNAALAVASIHSKITVRR